MKPAITDPPTPFEATLYAANMTDGESTDFASAVNRGATVQDTRISRWLEFEIPFYTKYAMLSQGSSTWEIYDTPQAIVGYYGPDALFTTQPTWTVLLSIGDDFSMAWPVSTPLLVYTPPAKAKSKGGKRPLPLGKEEIAQF